MDIVSINDWSTYLSAQASASASLTGLVFVAVSINLTGIISVPGLVGRAAESIIQLFGVFNLSTIGLVPKQSGAALGVELLALLPTFWSLQTLLQVIYMRRRTGHPLRWLMSRVIQTHLAGIPFFVSGVLLVRGSSAGLYRLALSFPWSAASQTRGCFWWRFCDSGSRRSTAASRV